MSGTGTSLAVMSRLAREFERDTPGARVLVVSSLGSSGAIQAVAGGSLQLAVSGRPLKEEERARGLVEREFARTPFLFATGPRVPERNVTTAELVAIYRGEKTSWSNGERVRLVLRPRADADTLLLKAISPEVSAAVEAAAERPGLVTAATNQDCNDALARTPGSVGPTSLLQLVGEGAELAPLSWNGVAPTVANLASGAYPLVKHLHLVVSAASGPATRRFVAFIASERGRRILEETGALPVAFRLDGP